MPRQISALGGDPDGLSEALYVAEVPGAAVQSEAVVARVAQSLSDDPERFRRHLLPVLHEIAEACP